MLSFQPGLRLNLATRAFRCDDLSGIIFADDQGKIVAVIMHLAPHLEMHSDVLSPVLGEKTYVEKGNISHGMVVLSTSLRQDDGEFANL